MTEDVFAIPPRVVRPSCRRNFVHRRIRFPVALDRALRVAANEERRTVQDLVRIIMEDWIAARSKGLDDT